MTTIAVNRAEVHTDATGRSLTATIRLPAPPARVFRALASREVTAWWVRPGVFDTREWTGDVRAGGTWRAGGIFRDKPYELEGTFVVVESPTRLTHSWHSVGAPTPASTVDCSLEPVNGGTLLKLEQSGFASPEACAATAEGWRTSLDRLAELLSAEHG